MGSKSTEAPAAAHFWQLDVARAIAAVGVFAYHWFGIRDNWRFIHYTAGRFDLDGRDATFWLLSPAMLGHAGVTLFFVLSGFCIHHAQLNAADRAGSESLDLVRFLSRRFWRIFPAYLIALLVFAAIYGNGLSNVLAHVAMIHNLEPRTILTINGSFWTLAVEWQFYLAYPALLAVASRIGMGRAAAIAVAVGLAYRSALYGFGVTPDNVVLWRLPVASYGLWCVGAWLAEAMRRPDPAVTRPVRVAAVAVAAVVAIAGEVFVAAQVVSDYAWGALSCLFLAAYLRSRRPASLPERAAVPLGLASYSFYLYHQPILIHLTWLQESREPRPDPALLAGGAAAFVLSLLVAAASYLLIERPGVRCGHHIKRWCGERLARRGVIADAPT